MLCKTGVPGLDDLLGGGMKRGRTYAVVGPTGSGKTTLGLQILSWGASRGENGLFVPLTQPVSTAMEDAKALALSIDGLVKSSKLFLEDLCPVFDPAGKKGSVPLPARLINSVQGHTASLGVKRVLIDGAEALEEDAWGEKTSMAPLIAAWNATTATTIVTIPLPADGRLPEACRYADGIIVVYLMQGPDGLTRAVQVLKHRGARHLSTVHMAKFSSKGLEIAKEPMREG